MCFVFKMSLFSAVCMDVGPLLEHMASPSSSHPRWDWLSLCLQPSIASSSSTRRGTSWVLLSSVTEFWLAWSCPTPVHTVIAAVSLCVKGPVRSDRFCFAADLYYTISVLGLNQAYVRIEATSWICYRVLYRPSENQFIPSSSSWVLSKDGSGLYLKLPCELSNCPHRSGHWALSQPCDGPSAVLTEGKWSSHSRGVIQI